MPPLRCVLRHARRGADQAAEVGGTNAEHVQAAQGQNTYKLLKDGRTFELKSDNSAVIGGEAATWSAEINCNGYHGTAVLQRLRFKVTHQSGETYQLSLKEDDFTQITPVMANLRKWRIAAFAIDAIYAAHRSAVNRVYSPGGAGYDEAKESFEAAAASQPPAAGAPTL